MNGTYTVTIYVVIDDILKAYGYQDDYRAQGSAAEILTVAVVAAQYLQNPHERTDLGFDLKAFASLLTLAFTNISNL